MSDNLVKLTKGARETIKRAVLNTGSDNQIVICEEVAKSLEEKYPGGSLEYQISEERMNLASTGAIMNAISSYLYNDYLSDEEKERIEEGYRLKDEFRKIVKEKGLSSSKKRYTNASYELFKKECDKLEKEWVSLATTDEKREELLEKLDKTMKLLIQR